MVHPQGESVVRDHTGHCKQDIARKSGEICPLAKRHAVEVRLWQRHLVKGPQPDTVAGKPKIEGELREAPNFLWPYLDPEFLLQLTDQRVDRLLVRLHRSAKTAPMVRIKDIRIGIA